ncbi:hypothetical protein Daus18300_001467 [Diaporthe australafricana]|uniref:Clr5 domain-containing protein n=1 Tax=Diaporthe australafricana TaxID=127596 RepID=A0ABR3XVS1_9PEZI
MKEEHSFDASQKLYKDKFKIWEWNKNLPISHANFMVDKAKKRKRQDEKETVFLFGGQRWTEERAQSTVARYSMRTKKARPEDHVPDVKTPKGVSYKTPKPLGGSDYDASTPQHDLEEELAHQDPGVSSHDGRVVTGSPSSQNSSFLQSDSDSSDDSSEIEVLEAPLESLGLRWKGQSRSGLHEMQRSAKARSEQRDWVAAERLFRESWEGFSHLLGSTHEDSIKVACSLAEMLAQNKRMEEADVVIDKSIHDHIHNLGFEHKKTQAHLLYCVELLNGWNREEDAGGLLAAALSRKESSSGIYTPPSSSSPHKRRARRTLRSPTDTSPKELTLAHVFDMLERDPTPADLDSGLQMARVHVAVKDPSVEALLTAFIQQCQKDPARFMVQHLRAISELLTYYEKADLVEQHEDEFVYAKGVFIMIWETFEWNSTNFVCVEILEAGLQLAVPLYKSGYEADAGSMFNSARDKCLQTFGATHETTIWTEISIGLVYQKYAESWVEADDWFQQAYSGALGNSSWGLEDGITMSLAKALDRRHFTYITDEGRPFKSIFGMTGVTIRPGRLHLD